MRSPGYAHSLPTSPGGPRGGNLEGGGGDPRGPGAGVRGALWPPPVIPQVEEAARRPQGQTCTLKALRQRGVPGGGLFCIWGAGRAPRPSWAALGGASFARGLPLTGSLQEGGCSLGAGVPWEAPKRFLGDTAWARRPLLAAPGSRRAASGVQLGSRRPCRWVPGPLREGDRVPHLPGSRAPRVSPPSASQLRGAGSRWPLGTDVWALVALLRLFISVAFSAPECALGGTSRLCRLRTAPAPDPTTALPLVSPDSVAEPPPLIPQHRRGHPVVPAATRGARPRHPDLSFLFRNSPPLGGGAYCSLLTNGKISHPRGPWGLRLLPGGPPRPSPPHPCNPASWPLAPALLGGF